MIQVEGMANEGLNSARSLTGNSWLVRTLAGVVPVPPDRLGRVAHRIHNTSAVSLVFVELQHGDSFGEDDIIWLDHDYGRREPLPAPAV